MQYTGYPKNTYQVLIYLGFVFEVDFYLVAEQGDTVSVTWQSVASIPTVAEIIAAEKPAYAVIKREEIYREQEIRSANIQMLSGMPLGFELPRTVIDILEETYSVILKSTARNAITASAPFWFGCKTLRDNRNTLLNGLETWVDDPLKTADDIAAFDVVNWAGWTVARP